MSSIEEFESKCIALGLRACILNFLSDPLSKSFLIKCQPTWLRSFSIRRLKDLLVPDSTGLDFREKLRIGLDHLPTHHLSKRQKAEWPGVRTVHSEVRQA